MARPVTLILRTGGLPFRVGVLVLFLAALLALIRAADEPMMQAADKVKPTAPATPTKMPATSAPTNLSATVPNTYNRYGKIVVTTDEVNYPLKLKMPFPGVGEVKVPTLDESVMRDKLEELSKLSDDQIRAELTQWPAFNRMSLRDEGTMLNRIQDFRDYHSKFAQQKAHDMGLLTLTDADKARFEKEYWDKKLQMDHDLSKQFGPIFKARGQKMEDDLYREFSSTAPGSIVQAPKPPAPKTPVPAPTTPKPSANTSTEPVASAPK